MTAQSKHPHSKKNIPIRRSSRLPYKSKRGLDDHRKWLSRLQKEKFK